MEAASSSSYTMSLMLEEKVADLENKLSHMHQALRAKENVLHLQQDQIKKMEEMYKKCLDDVANVTCEHKKTLHDLENLRIILKSYENRHIQTANFECQVTIELDELPNEDALERSEQLAKISEFIVQQNERTEYIINLLQVQDASNDKMENIQSCIEDLQRVSQTLLETSEHRTLQSLAPRAVIMPLEEFTDESPVALLKEACSQTRQELRDCACNQPESITSTSSQTKMMFRAAMGTCTDHGRPSNHKSTICTISTAHQIVHTSLFHAMDRFHEEIAVLHKKLGTYENIFTQHDYVLNAFDKLLKYAQQKDEEACELHERALQLDAIISRTSALTITEIKEMCRDITMRTGEDYKAMYNELSSLRAEVDMLRVENGELSRRGNSNISRIVVELTNACTQTLEAAGEADEDLDVHGQLKTMSETIRTLEEQLKSHEHDARLLDELKELTLKMNAESAELHADQLRQLHAKYERELEDLRRQLNEVTLLEQEQRGQLATLTERPQMRATSTQIYGYVPMIEQIDMLKIENDRLLKQIRQVKQEVELERTNKSVVEELKLMCINLGQNISDSAALTNENGRLKVQLEETLRSGHEEFEKLQQTYFDAIAKAREEVYNLRLENKELSEGIAELRMVVDQNPRPCSRMTSTMGSDTTLDAAQSTHGDGCVEGKTNSRTLSSMSDLEDLKSLCKDISKRLKCKHVHSNQINQRLELLGSLENDLRLLMKEFLDFKWYTQMESQRLVLKHGELVNQNEELVSCLNQYKNVNESLLQSHYELEKSKNQAALEHQVLVEDYLRLQEELDAHKTDGNENSTNTILLGHDIDELIMARKQNAKLQLEIDNLRVQIQEHHVIYMKQKQSLKECDTCATTLKALQSLNQDYKQTKNENASLHNLLREKDAQMAELRVQLQRVEDEYTKHTDELRNDVNRVHVQLQCILREKEQLVQELDDIRTDYKRLREEAVENQDKLNEHALDISRYQEEIAMLQGAIAKVASVKEKNQLLEAEVEELRTRLNGQEALLASNEHVLRDYRTLEEQLAEVSDIKAKLESEFDNYIRTNNVVHSTLAKQNEGLDQEAKTLKQENTRLLDRLQEMQHSQNASRTELVRVVDECKNYKAQLEDMARRIDLHLQEHLAYKMEVETVKARLQDEIASLKEMLQFQHMQADAFETLCSDSPDTERHMQDLKTFINTKELEIDFLMDQKLRAMEAIGKCLDKSKKGKKPISEAASARKREDSAFKMLVSIKRPMREHSFEQDRRQHCQPPSGQTRSASVPRVRAAARNKIHAWEKEQTKQVRKGSTSRAKKY